MYCKKELLDTAMLSKCFYDREQIDSIEKLKVMTNKCLIPKKEKLILLHRFYFVRVTARTIGLYLNTELEK